MVSKHLKWRNAAVCRLTKAHRHTQEETLTQTFYKLHRDGAERFPCCLPAALAAPTESLWTDATTRNVVAIQRQTNRNTFTLTKTHTWSRRCSTCTKHNCLMAIFQLYILLYILLLVTLYCHHTGQPALASTHSWELDDFAGAKFYCPHALADGI